MNGEYSFGGRLREKEPEPTSLELVNLPHERNAFIYQRLSSHEQVKKSVYSIAMQDALVDLAIEDGYPEDMVIVERRDLGISGTLGQEKREGLAHLVSLIESGLVESVYVVHVSRLFRDQTLIDGLTFGELCKQHNVTMVMPNMRLNLRDKMHMRIYRMELERAADELELMRMRLLGARDLKAKQGYFSSGSVPVGYILDNDKESETYDKYLIYEPHAEIVRHVCKRLPELDFSHFRVSQECNRDDIYIPFFPPELRYMETKSATKCMTEVEGEGWMITPTFVKRAVTNPAYIGWWVWGGEVINKSNHEPILDETLFWTIQDAYAGRRSRGSTVYHDPLILQDLLYCGNHDEPQPMQYHRAEGRYMCQNEYVLGLTDTLCLCVKNYILDEPIGEFILSQLSLPKYAERVLEQIKDGYDEAEERAEASRRQLARLKKEIDNLKENLAYTRTQEQVEMILEMIDQKLVEKERLSKVDAYPVGEVGKAIDIEGVRSFLQNPESIWDGQPSRIRNNFLKIILDRIVVTHGNIDIYAQLVFRTGSEATLLIKRPLTTHNHTWTDEEDRILLENYETASWAKLLKLLPGRTYNAIISRAVKVYGLKRNAKERFIQKRRKWTEEEEELLVDVAEGRMSIYEAAELLDRTYSAVRARVKKMNLAPIKSTRRPTNIFWEVVNRDRLSDECYASTAACECPDRGLP